VIYKFNDRFVLIYSKLDGKSTNVYVAFSGDLNIWLKEREAIFTHGGFGAWDQNHVAIVSVLKLDDGYVGFYEGEDKNNRYRIGIAYTKDFLKWERFSGNPIIDIGDSGSLDEKMACSPHFIEKDGKIYLFYTGHNRFMNASVCLAIGRRKE
jgi:hypothetical protein